MPRVLCKYIDCVFLEKGACSADAISLHPDEGCLTYTTMDEFEEDAVWEYESEEYSNEEDDDGGNYLKDDEAAWMDEDGVL